MDTHAIIDDYVNNVAAKLPRRQRNDIGLELRTLLTEQVRSAAQSAGRSPDGEMTVEVLRHFGRPDEVAARYAPAGFQLIESEYVPLVLKLAAICIAIQWAVTLPLVFYARLTFGEWWLRWGFSAFAWCGVLVLWFAAASWVQRRFPIDPDGGARPGIHWLFWVPFPRDWRPGEPEATERRAALGAAPIGAVLTILFIAPAWMLRHLLPAGVNTSWALYDADFARWLLPPLITLMAVCLLLFAAVTLNERWRAPTEGIRFGLRVCFVALLYWAVFGWHIFVNPLTEALFKAWLLFFLLVNTVQILLRVRRYATRVPESIEKSVDR
jgi:hypothetical protein